MHRKQSNDRHRDEPLSPADYLFAELDHRRVGEGPVSWLTEVAAIHMVRHEAWVQVAPVGESSRSVILHLSARATAKHALATLAAFWSQRVEEAAPQVIHVLQPVSIA
jgi:hypothetical protein